MALHEEIAKDITKYYWDENYEELADRFGCSKTTLTRARKEAGLPRKSEKNRVAYEHGVPIGRVLYHLHHDMGLSENEMSDVLGVARATLTEWFLDEGVEKRGRSEAEKLKWAQMGEEQQEKQVKAAHKARRKLPRFNTTLRGYEEIRHRRQEFKLHRLAAVAWHGMDSVKGKHVHHKNKIPWDNREDNLELMEPAEHYRHHANERRDEATGRFV